MFCPSSKSTHLSRMDEGSLCGCTTAMCHIQEIIKALLCSRSEFEIDQSLPISLITQLNAIDSLRNADLNKLLTCWIEVMCCLLIAAKFELVIIWDYGQLLAHLCL
eukprot:GHVP01065222.1.p1 GENE.GHVP01065222.1~~GHVP01065222.1.p1  ORF type:complete len:106 (-),score=5.48 GHVP01065222.1:75-392(-)